METFLYDELHRVEQTHWWFRARRQIVWSLVRRYIGGESDRRLKICELGCGTGGNLAVAAQRHDVVGLECSELALSYAQRILGDRVRYGRLPDEIDLPPANFDVVLLTDVLEHIEDDAASARTALSLLRPGGIVLATVPAYQWLYSPRDAHHHHFRRYSKRQFAALWSGTDAEALLLSHYNSILFLPAAAVRLASKLFTPRKQPGDLKVPPTFANTILTRLMGSEANVLGRLPLPFGLSLVAVVRKLVTADVRRRTLSAA
jgi:2-polyprenyl-3-methyl-5-hydroxy-6-metoxy-1,4-benzoquinol methylase